MNCVNGLPSFQTPFVQQPSLRTSKLSVFHFNSLYTSCTREITWTRKVMPLGCLQSYCVSNSLEGLLPHHFCRRARVAPRTLRFFFFCCFFVSKLRSHLRVRLFHTYYSLPCDIEHHNYFLTSGGAPSR